MTNYKQLYTLYKGDTELRTHSIYYEILIGILLYKPSYRTYGQVTRNVLQHIAECCVPII